MNPLTRWSPPSFKLKKIHQSQPHPVRQMNRSPGRAKADSWLILCSATIWAEIDYASCAHPYLSLSPPADTLSQSKRPTSGLASGLHKSPTGPNMILSWILPDAIVSCQRLSLSLTTCWYREPKWCCTAKYSSFRYTSVQCIVFSLSNCFFLLLWNMILQFSVHILSWSVKCQCLFTKE